MESFSQDPHEILGIPRDATEKRIRKAYRRLAMRFHPDKNPREPEAEMRFKQVQAAYETLMSGKGPQGASPASFTDTSGTRPCHLEPSILQLLFSCEGILFEKEYLLIWLNAPETGRNYRHFDRRKSSNVWG